MFRADDESYIETIHNRYQVVSLRHLVVSLLPSTVNRTHAVTITSIACPHFPFINSY